MTPKQYEKRAAAIAAAIKKARDEGRYDAAEHQASLIDDFKDSVQEAWIEEAFDGVSALKKAWGKVWKIRYYRWSVRVIFKSENYLYLKVPCVRQKNFKGVPTVFRYSGPLLGEVLFTKLVHKGLVEGVGSYAARRN